MTGDISLTTDGYTTVAASTAGGETAVTMINNEATMEVTLPDGAFTSETPVAFSITNQPASVETIDGNTVTHLGTYNFEFAIPTLNSAAELNFEIELAAMDEPDRLSLLDLLHDGAVLTLGVRGDAPGAELQLFDVCAAGGPVADSCVVVQWLDENRMLLDPLGGIDPSILRLEGLVGHFSTYSFVAVTSPRRLQPRRHRRRGRLRRVAEDRRHAGRLRHLAGELRRCVSCNWGRQRILIQHDGARTGKRFAADVGSRYRDISRTPNCFAGTINSLAIELLHQTTPL